MAVITFGNGYSSSANSPFNTTLPSGIVNGSLCVVFGAVSGTDRTLTPTLSGVTWTALPTTSDVSSTSHRVFGWYATVNAANVGQNITWTQTGGTTLKQSAVGVVITNPHATPFNQVLGEARTSSATTKTTPSVTTSVADCIEIQVVSDNRGSTTPATDLWTAPSPAIEGSQAAFSGGTTAITSVAIGFNDDVRANGTAMGNDVWSAFHTTGTVASSAVGTAWTLAIRVVPEPSTLTFSAVTASGWTPTGGTAQAVLADTDDGTYLTSPTNPSSSIVDMTLRPIVQPTGNFVVTLRALRTDATSSSVAVTLRSSGGSTRGIL